jgi:undecaprenyl diphosphate synthase
MAAARFPVLPQHIAIIMDGNGRWARKRFLPRVAGHPMGVKSIHRVVNACLEYGIPYLTLFAFSSENWKRPQEEVSLLMQLFMKVLANEVEAMHEKGIRLKLVGDRSQFQPELVKLIEFAESRTCENRALTLSIAANYGGKWDILQAVRRLAQECPDALAALDDVTLAKYLALSYGPDPDLFIRTGGEQRISNFLIWQTAYSELYFTDELWPDFDRASLERALESFARRERRFGQTSEQVQHSAIAGSSGVIEPHA